MGILKALLKKLFSQELAITFFFSLFLGQIPVSFANCKVFTKFYSFSSKNEFKFVIFKNIFYHIFKKIFSLLIIFLEILFSAQIEKTKLIFP